MRLMKFLRSTEEQQNFTDNMQGLEMFKKTPKPKAQTNQEVRTTPVSTLGSFGQNKQLISKLQKKAMYPV